LSKKYKEPVPENLSRISLDPAERRATLVVAAVAVLRMFGLFALLPVMSLFAGGLPGATPLLVGMAVGGYGLTQAALQIPFGALSDRVGRVRVILAGLALFAAGSVIAAMSESIWGVIAGRMLQGAGAVSATLTALLADATRDEVRTRTMAVLGIGVGAAFLLALIAGPLIAAAAGVRALFWMAAMLAGFAALTLIALPSGIVRQPPAAPVALRAAFRADLLRLDLYIFILHALLTANFVALPFLLQNEIALPVGAHWQIYTSALVLSLVGAVPLILGDGRRGDARLVGIAVGLLLLGELLLAFGGFAVPAVIVGLALFFAGFNFLEAGLPARLSIRAEGAVRGASLGAFASSQFLGIFAGGMLGGRLLASGAPADVFSGAAAIAAAWLVFHMAGRAGQDAGAA
jgi:MFS family permease